MVVEKLSMAALFFSVLVLLLCLSPLSTSSPTYLSFPLTHRDARGSRVRGQEADLPEEMPMREFVVAGRAMRSRITNQRRGRRHGGGPPAPVVGSFSYLKENVGDFYLTISVGTPPQSLTLNVDTGSELTWTQCVPCKVCSTAGGPTFAFNKSSSYNAVPCTSPLCTQSLEFSSGCNNSTGSCTFRAQYGDGSTDAGYIAVDAFHLDARSTKALVFGCAVTSLDTVPDPASGIVGLNAGPFSFTSQLLGSNTKVSNKFAYCLPDRFANLNSEGTIKFGNYQLPVKLRHTPLVPPFGPLGYFYYFVKLEGISVGKTFIRARVKDVGVGTRGTIFDSGTAVTHLVRDLYVKMIVELRNQTARLNPFVSKEPAEDVCYRVSLKAKELPKVPLITMHFANKVVLELGPESILYPTGVDEQGGILCLAFRSSQASFPLNVIGNYQQQNHWVEYNLQTSRLGLAKASCVSRRQR